MTTSVVLTAGLILAASLGYSLGTIGMKIASNSVSTAAIVLVCAGFAAATLAEIVLMRGITLGVLYLTIIAIETLMVLAVAFGIGEGLSPPQMLGGALVLAGLGVISLTESV